MYLWKPVLSLIRLKSGILTQRKDRIILHLLFSGHEIDSKSTVSWKKNQEKSQDQEQDQKSDTVAKADSEAVQIFFMVQVSASATRTEVKPENFKGLKDITEITTQESYKYAAGSFAEYQDAVNYRNLIKSSYPDAFVIAVKDNKILLLQQALDQKRKTQKDN